GRGAVAIVRFAPTEPSTGRQDRQYEYQCTQRGTREGQVKKSAIRYSVSRRRFLRDATLTSLGVVAAACTPGSTSPSPTGSGAASVKGGEFHGAWPYDLPPKGHYNYFAAAGIILQGAIYVDLLQPPLATWLWNDAKG